MNPSGLQAEAPYFDPDTRDVIAEALARPPVAFRESWRVIPLPRERGLVVSLLHHWGSLVSGSGLPDIGRLDPQALPAAWRNCLLVRHVPDQESWSYDYLGSAFIEDSGDVASVIRGSELQDRIARWFDLALLTGRPMTLGGGFRLRSGLPARFRAALLPFGSDGDEVTHLLAATSARELLSLEPRHLPIEAHTYIDGFWVHQPALP